MRNLLRNIVKEESLDYIVKNYKSLRDLCTAPEKELMDIPHIGSSKARQLKTILELSQNLLLPDKEIEKISSPKDVFNLLQIMGLYQEERFIGVFLNTKNTVIDQLLISKGSINSSIVHPREVFSPAIRLKASAMILVHNHPSGDPTPSPEDIEVTKRLVDAGKILGIEVLDHVVIGEGKFVSFKEKGLM